MKRRDFLWSTMAATLAPRVALAAGTHDLVAQTVSAQILPEGSFPPSELLGFNGSVPGPTLRVKQTETFSIRLRNDLTEGTAVHWHGVRLRNDMDGVPMLTQDIVDPGATFDYRFSAPDAGTFWYHSHYLSHEQVARGLMGPFIVEESETPDVDHDIVAMLADWRFDQTGTLADDYGNMHDVAHAGRLGNYAKAFLPEVVLQKGQRIRLRLINASVDRVMPLELRGLDGKIVSLDGMPLATPRDMAGLLLAPAQRADVIADVSDKVEILLVSNADTFALGSLAIDGQVSQRSAPIAPLPLNKVSVPDTASQNLTLNMQGGAMARGHSGDNIWAFNDKSDLQPDPFGTFSRGETVRITLVNNTAFAHGIHLHGHHFYELAEDGSLGDLRDTTLVQAGAKRDILCVFDNPGRWMLHCHMLSHSVGGMKTWVQVN
jgi:FtsP/CotA-like multicopper oxidase with cupredoxin domain